MFDLDRECDGDLLKVTSIMYSRARCYVPCGWGGVGGGSELQTMTGT